MKYKDISKTDITKTVEERFWSYVNKNGPLIIETECWPWIGSNFVRGYGVFHLKRDKNRRSVKLRAHRVSYFLAHKFISSKLNVCHKCDNPSCCNPNHLWQGTQQDNANDMVKKGRQAKGDKSSSRLYPESRPRGDKHWHNLYPEKTPRGEKHYNSKLTEKKVIEIRKLKNKMTERNIAKMFNRHRATIHDILIRKTWKHI